MPEPLKFSTHVDPAGFAAGVANLERLGAHFANKLESTVGKAFTSLAVGPVAALGAAITGAFAGRAIADGVAQVFDAGRALQVMSRQTGASAEGLAILGAKFNAAGLSADTVARSIFRLQKSIAGVEDEENKGGSAAIEKLGLSLTALQHMTPDKELFAVGSAISRISDNSERGATAMKIFGRAGAELGALFNSRGFGEITPNMAINARVLAASSAAFEQTSLRLTRAGDLFKSFYLGVGVGLTKGLTPILDQIERINLVAVGQKFGAALVTASQVFVGAFKNPGALADAVFYALMADNAKMGNALIASFRYAGESLVATFHALPGIATHLTDGLGFGLLAAAEKFSAATLTGVSKAGAAFTAAITWVSDHGVDQLGTKLLEAAKSFAGAMVSALAGPQKAIDEIIANLAVRAKNAMAGEGAETLDTVMTRAVNGKGTDLGGALDERAGINAGKAGQSFSQAASAAGAALSSPKFTVPDVLGAGAASARATQAIKTMRRAGAATIGTAAPTADGGTRQPSFADHVGMANMRMALANSGINPNGMDPGKIATLAESHMFMGHSGMPGTARTNATDPYTARVDAARRFNMFSQHTIGIGGALDFDPSKRPGWTGAKNATVQGGLGGGAYGQTGNIWRRGGIGRPGEAEARAREAANRGATSADVTGTTKAVAELRGELTALNAKIAILVGAGAGSSGNSGGATVAGK